MIRKPIVVKLVVKNELARKVQKFNGVSSLGCQIPNFGSAFPISLYHVICDKICTSFVFFLKEFVGTLGWCKVDVVVFTRSVYDACI
jgi:hypothetical protein